MKKNIGLLLALCFAASVQAQTAAERVTVEAPWVRLNAPGTKGTGAFMTLHNGGNKDLAVLKAASPVATVSELHTHLNEGGVMKMRQIPSIPLKSKSLTMLKPGGLHVMLIDLKTTLKEGEMVTISLGFDDGSSKTIEAQVKKPGNEHNQGHGK